MFKILTDEVAAEITLMFRSLIYVGHVSHKVDILFDNEAD